LTHLSMTHGTARIVVGVDTHADVHVAAALDLLGRVVGRLEVPTTAHGYGRLLGWSRALDANVIFGVEGTGAYGAGLARYLTASGCDVAEVNRPDRRDRRSRGKSDPLDAEAAARVAFPNGANCVPTTCLGLLPSPDLSRRGPPIPSLVTLSTRHSSRSLRPADSQLVGRPFTDT